MPTQQPPTAPADPPEPADDLPTAPPHERAAVRASAALACVAWPAAIALVAGQDTGPTLSPTVFAFTASWTIGLGCLGLGTAFIRPRDPLAAWERGIGPSHLVRRVLAHTATACWALAGGYTVTMAMHLYRLPPVASVFTLILFLALAVWCTVIVLVAPAKTRLESAFLIERSAVEQLRAERRRAFDAARLAASVALDEADGARADGALGHRHGLRAVGCDERATRPEGRDLASGRDAAGQ